MKASLRVLDILGLERTWPLIGAAKSAIETEAKFAGCTIEEAAGAIIEEAHQTRRRGESVGFFAQSHAERMGRMRRLTNKEQRKVILGVEFVEDCPCCACGNLHIKRKHNDKLFVGCDCFRTDCRCEYSYAVPELISVPQADLGGTNEIELAKAKIAAAQRCLNHGAPMSERRGSYGPFAFCTVKGCEYKKSLETWGVNRRKSSQSRLQAAPDVLENEQTVPVEDDLHQNWRTRPSSWHPDERGLTGITGEGEDVLQQLLTWAWKHPERWVPTTCSRPVVDGGAYMNQEELDKHWLPHIFFLTSIGRITPKTIDGMDGWIVPSAKEWRQLHGRKRRKLTLVWSNPIG